MILIIGVVRYLMLVEETNMVKAIPRAHVYNKKYHSFRAYCSISRLFTLGDNCELKGVHKGFTKVHASGVIIVLL